MPLNAKISCHSVYFGIIWCMLWPLGVFFEDKKVFANTPTNNKPPYISLLSIAKFCGEQFHKSPKGKVRNPVMSYGGAVG
jgi:hypothetical protein